MMHVFQRFNWTRGHYFFCSEFVEEQIREFDGAAKNFISVVATHSHIFRLIVLHVEHLRTVSVGFDCQPQRLAAARFLQCLRTINSGKKQTQRNNYIRTSVRMYAQARTNILLVYLLRTIQIIKNIKYRGDSYHSHMHNVEITEEKQQKWFTGLDKTQRIFCRIYELVY